MKTLTSFVGTLLVLASVPGLSLAQYSGGKGTAENPYQIAAVADLRTLTKDPSNWDKHFRLMADLDLSGTSLDPIAKGSAFTGRFDGSGHIVSHFTCTAPWYSDIGLFRSIGVEGVVMNLGVTDVTLQGGYCVGALAGYNAGTVTGCFTTGRCVGGRRVGGLVGENDGLISRCYSWAEASGEYDVGGLVGELSEGSLIECYSTGRVSSTGAYYHLGGLVGMKWNCVVAGCFWDTQSSGLSSSDGGAGRTTAQMQSIQTFQSAGWDFLFTNDGSVDAWALPEGGGYPILWWQAESLPVLPAFGGGTGTPDAPYLVTTADHLNAIGANPRLVDRCYRLTADIDLAGIPPKPVGDQGTAFTGHFDGDGYEIRHWTSGTRYAGGGGSPVFPRIGRNGLVQNLAVTDANVGGGSDLAALAGQNQGIVRNCCSTGCVRGYAVIGGLVADNAGQIAGCYSEVTVSADTYMSSFVGGLTGVNRGSIEDSYATGEVSASNSSGAGLVGQNIGCLSRCYAAGSVSSPWGQMGGLVTQNTGIVFNCFWDVDSSNQYGGAGGKGRGTAQMKQGGTFLGWGGCAESIWTCRDGEDYPRLAWETRRGPAIPPQTLADFLPGTGTPEDPYLISTAEELAAVGAFPCEWDKHFKLVADLDLRAYSDLEYDRIGLDSVRAFSGTFDGAGHRIHDWTFVVSNSDAGLFGYVGPGGDIRGLSIDTVIVVGGNRVGILAGSNAGTLSDCHVAGLVCATGQDAGPLVGRSLGGAIASCSAQGSCTAYENAGGLAGTVQGGEVASCDADATVVGDYHAGGLIGVNAGTITLCRAAGTASADEYAGGLIGFNEMGGSVSNSYSLAVVTAGRYVGGLAGALGEGRVSNCYAAGPVVGGGDTAGGLIGGDSYSYSEGVVVKSFWDIAATGQTSSRGGLGKTTVQMQTASTFTGSNWDFENVWTICEGNDYPRLQWEEDECGD